MREKFLLTDHSSHRLTIEQLPQGITLLREGKPHDIDNVIYYWWKKIDVTDPRVHMPYINTFSNLLNRDEIYFPIAFLNQDGPIGGAYIYLWTCNKDTHKNYLTESDDSLPVAVFHTGACMFGSMLYGIDDKNQKHSLTDPKVVIPETCMIEHIQNDHELHPDELLSKQSLTLAYGGSDTYSGL